MNYEDSYKLEIPCEPYPMMVFDCDEYRSRLIEYDGVVVRIFRGAAPSGAVSIGMGLRAMCAPMLREAQKT